MAKHLNLTWYEDKKAEFDLERMAIPFAVERIPFSKLNLRESQYNGARSGDPLIPAVIEDYIQAMRNGATFPRIIVHKTPSGYIVLGGNQRCEAIRLLIQEGDLPKSVSIEAYVVGTSDKFLLEILARSANAAHGKGADKTERIAHALHCVRNLGMSTSDASIAFVVAQATINQHMRAEEQRKSLKQAGVDASKVPVTTLDPIAKLDSDASAQLKLGKLVVQHMPTAERVRQVVGTLTSKPSATARMQVIKAFERELSEAAHSGNGHRNGHANGNGNGHGVSLAKAPSRPRRDKLNRLVAALNNFLESENAGESFTSLDQLQVVTDSDREKFTKALKALAYRIKVILK